MSDSDSDDDFFPVPKNFGGVIEEVDYNNSDKVDLHRDTAVFVNHAIDCILYRDIALVEKLTAQVESNKEKLTDRVYTEYLRTCTSINMLLSGDYLVLVSTSCHASISYTQLVAHLTSTDLSALHLHMQSFMASAADAIEVQLRMVECLVTGLAYMELFCQMNYTGPELPPSLLTVFLSDPNSSRPAAEPVLAPQQSSPVPVLGDWGGAAREVAYLDDKALMREQRRFHASCIAALEVDGEYPYSIVEIPVCLVLARVILSSLASPELNLWGHGVQFKSSSGAVESSNDVVEGETDSVYARVATKGLVVALSAAMLPGGGSVPMTNIQVLKKVLGVFVAPLAWCAARCAVTHLRLIMYTAPSTVSGRSDGGGMVTIEKVPTLWCECQDLFASTLPVFGDLCGLNHQCSVARQAIQYLSAPACIATGCYLPFEPLIADDPAVDPPSVTLTLTPDHVRLFKQSLEVQCWLEYGLLMYFFNTERQGKKYFGYAKGSAKLTVSLTGAMGKKTKYQKDDFAQLYVHTESEFMYLTVQSERSVPKSVPATVASSSNTASMTATGSAAKPTEAAEGAPTDGALRFEIGKHIIKDSASGDEVAVREVMFGSVAEGGSIGGYDDNIYFDDGVRYTDDVAQFRSNSAAAVAGGRSEAAIKEAAQRGLHYIDEAVVLALCLDVANSNPADGLTNEEMIPYVQCVLNRSIADKKNKKKAVAVAAAEVAEVGANVEIAPPNWMIYSTALLQRSWIEFEKGRTMDRAMLQIQALIDQHSTKLTVMQPTYEAAVEQSAPVQDRMRYLFSIVYPPQYELKVELAQRYLTCGVYNSALGYFKELQMWDDVVACYQLLEKPHRAEMLVRERLACTDGTGGETPYMLTSLGDITQKAEYYERAWELSGRRYARAKRTLGRMCFDKGRYPEAIEHFSAALAVQPATANIWYMKGVSCMRIEDLDGAIEAFVRCNNQQSKEDEYSEAFSNLGAIYVQRQLYSKAHAAFTDALRLSHDNWKIIENLMITSLLLGKQVECIQCMQKLVDLRLKSHRPVHIEELHRLSYLIACEQLAQWKRDLIPETTGNYIDDCPAVPAAVKLWAPSVNCAHPNRSTRALGTETKRLVNLMFNITNAIKSNSQVWGIFAELMDALGYLYISVGFRTKQIRAYVIEYSEIYKQRIGGSEQKTVDDFFEHCVNCVENLGLTLQRLKAGNAALPTPSPEAMRLSGECKSLLKTLVSKLQTQSVPSLPQPPSETAATAATDSSANTDAAPKQVHFSSDELENGSTDGDGRSASGSGSVFAMEDANEYINTIIMEMNKLE